MTPREMIRELEDLQALLDLLNSDYATKKAEILKPVLQQVADELTALDMEYEPILTQAAGQVAAAKERVIEAVKHAGESVKGERLMAVWSKPRTTWDGKALEGYAAAHPEISQFKKVGEPTVSIRSM